MKMKQGIEIFCAMALLVSPAMSQASESGQGYNTVDANGTEPSGTTDTSGNYYNIPAGAMGGGSSGAGDGAASARRAQNLQYGMAAVSAGIGAWMLSKCPEPLQCAMGAMAVAQAAVTIGTAAGAKKSGDEFSAKGYQAPGLYPGGAGQLDSCPGCTNGVDYGGGQGGSNAASTDDPIFQQIRDNVSQLKQNLRSKGIEVDEKNQTVKLPNGKTVPFSSITSDAGMASAGFSAEEIARAKADMKKAESATMAKYQGLLAGDTGSGGGGGGGVGGPRGNSTGSMNNFRMNMYGNKARPKAGTVSGMSKKLGDDNIGVAGDNIFEMMSRRYKAYDAASSFIKD